MKVFKDIITLNKNSRGCYILDTVKGCSGCNENRPNGCYDNCYAQNIAKRYRFDFNNPVKRIFKTDKSVPMLFDFYDEKHMSEIIRQIKSIDMPFVRIGEMGDPSEDWEHTINVCSAISIAKKPIVIITKHWKEIPSALLPSIRSMDICINTSISALDSDQEIKYRLIQYEKLKSYCNSALRIVSCDFNLDTNDGYKKYLVQKELFKNTNIINTVFRPSVDNELVTSGIIKVEKVKFLRSKVLASMYYPDSFLGFCNDCPDMCGIKASIA